jgi:uncharacterized membrane protein YhaH (DUF805 family)
MSTLKIGDLLRIFDRPGVPATEERPPAVERTAKDSYSRLMRYLEKGELVIQKEYHGALSGMQRAEKTNLEYVNSGFQEDDEARKYLAACLELKTQVFTFGEMQTEILMQWHGFDLEDFMRLLPMEEPGNAHWRDPVFLLQLLRHALHALRALHRMGIVHADIKWDNITLEFDWRNFSRSSREIVLKPENLRLIDFGLSLGAAPVYGHLKKVGLNYEAAQLSPRLRAAREELNRGVDKAIREVDFKDDLFSLGYIFANHLIRLKVKGNDPTLLCLNKTHHDLLRLGEHEDRAIEREDGGGSLSECEEVYDYLLQRIETCLGQNAPDAWTFVLPGNDVLRRRERELETAADEAEVPRLPESAPPPEKATITATLLEELFHGEIPEDARQLTTVQQVIDYVRLHTETHATPPSAKPPAQQPPPVAGNDYCALKYFSFNGRLGRIRYLAWLFSAGGVASLVLLCLLYSLKAFGVSTHADLFPVCFWIVFYAPLTIRRLKDVNLPKRWVIVPLIPPVLCELFLFAHYQNIGPTSAINNALVVSFLAFSATLLFTVFLFLKRGSTGRNHYGPPAPPNSMLTAILAGVAIICASVMLAFYVYAIHNASLSLFFKLSSRVL